jgi:phosphate transport system substrate-binding protein
VKASRLIASLASVATVLSLAACGSSSSPSSETSNTAASTSGSTKTLVGAGSTLVAPLISVWEPEYLKEPGEVSVAYSAIGSGGGIASITARDVDFGASDAPLTEDQFKEAKGVVQIPWALGSVVAIYHVEGVPNHLKLTGPVLSEIYLGKITTWNDSKIAALNPGVKLPSTKITPVYRSDGSGDTYAFTNYLSHVSPEWKSKVGTSTQVTFPAGVGAKGSSGIAAAVPSTNGSIGYLTLAYVLEDELDDAVLQNAAGDYPVPGPKSIEAAAKTLTSVPANNEISIVDPPASAPEAYPISTFTYALVPEKSQHASTLKTFLKWAITKGQSFGPKLDFVPIPEMVRSADEATIEKITEG